MKDKPINIKEVLVVNLGKQTKDTVSDIAHGRKKAKVPRHTIGEVVEELLNEGLKTITK